MDVVVIRHKAERWIAVLCLGLFLCLAIWSYYADGIGLGSFFVLCGLLLTAFFGWLGTMVDMVSETGVSRKGLCFHRHISWDQIKRVAAVHMNLGGNPQWYLAVNWLSESGKIQGFLFIYREDLRNALIRYYGPLDAEKTDERISDK